MRREVLAARAKPPSLPNSTAWGFFMTISYMTVSMFVKEKMHGGPLDRN